MVFYTSFYVTLTTNTLFMLELLRVCDVEDVDGRRKVRVIFKKLQDTGPDVT